MKPPIDESVLIARPVAEVFAFVADFENLPRFCATSTAVQKISPGPIGRGTVFRQVFALYGWKMETPVELAEFEAGRSLTYRSEGGPRVEGVCTFQPAGSGTTLRYTLALRPRAGYRLLAPLLVRILRRQTRADLARLKALLEASAGLAGVEHEGGAGEGLRDRAAPAR